MSLIVQYRCDVCGALSDQHAGGVQSAEKDIHAKGWTRSSLRDLCPTCSADVAKRGLSVMAEARTAEGRRLREILSDGKWHNRSDVIDQLAKVVAPWRAQRYYTVKGLDPEEARLQGQRSLARHAIQYGITRHWIEVDKQGNQMRIRMTSNVIATPSHRGPTFPPGTAEAMILAKLVDGRWRSRMDDIVVPLLDSFEWPVIQTALRRGLTEGWLEQEENWLRKMNPNRREPGFDRSPWRSRMTRELSDGKWHSREAILEAGREVVPEERARRRFHQGIMKRATTDRSNHWTPERSLRYGREQITGEVMGAMERLGIVIRDKDEVRFSAWGLAEWRKQHGEVGDGGDSGSD